MRKCRKCKETIPSYVKIDGKKKSLRTRVFCLNCSPFGSHNTKSDDPARIIEGKRKRIPYGDLPEERKERYRKAIREKGRKRKIELIKIHGGKCKECDYGKCIRGLSFHHRDPILKEFLLTTERLVRVSWERALEESKKCDLLCVRCHAELHASESEFL